VLSVNQIARRETNLAGQTSKEQKKEVFCGARPEPDPHSPPLHLCLATEDQPPAISTVTFDIDSVVGYATSLAVAKQGLRWHPTQLVVSDLQASLHLSPVRVYYEDSHGHPHAVRQPIHLVPHYTFGRLVGLEDVSLYVLFPRLYRENQQCSRLRDEDFQIWMDQVLLPAIYQHYPSTMVQHYPSSFNHSRSNATARGVELRSQRVDATAREQILSYFLPPDTLHQVWETVLQTIEQPGLHRFRGLQLLIQAKNLKTLTKDTTWHAMTQRFQQYWDHAVAEPYTTPRLFFDIGKETCPSLWSSVMPVDGPAGNSDANATAQVLLWKRCCLDAYAQWIQNAHGPTRDGYSKVFYPMSMLQDSGSLTLETHQSSWSRQAGLLYTQFYASVKEIFAAGNTYPFTNTAIETLALDPGLRKTWQSIGRGLSHDPVALMRAYLYTKRRCHHALHGSQRKSFGLREEHRVSYDLFQQIDYELHQRQQGQAPVLSSPPNRHTFYTYPTSTLAAWFRWSVNKFCVGFEMVYSLHDYHFVTWEHTRMMLMFLRCLQFSYSTGLIQRVGGCWRDVRLQPDPTQPDGLRRWEGLGFQRTMIQYRYAWFLDKVDWATLTFRQPSAQYMMFNNPSLQAAYQVHVRQVRDVRVDFIRVDKVRQWMLEFSGVFPCLKLLEDCLCQLCLCAFRKDVFTHVKLFLRPDCRDAALAGQTPLSGPSIEQVFQERYLPLHTATGNRIAVKGIDTLFSWLWEWKDGRYERNGWSEKPYRLLYQRSFEAITLARGKDHARAWKKGLKLVFVRSHWLLPYPQKNSFMRKSKDTGAVVWWSSYHGGLDRYYQRLAGHGSLLQKLPASYTKHHPDTGWLIARHTSPWMPYSVQPDVRLVNISEADLYQRLLQVQGQFNQSLEANTPQITPRPPVIWQIPDLFEVSGPPHRAGTKPEHWKFTDCCTELRKTLDDYEVLHHHGYNLRRARRPRSGGSDSDDSPSFEENLTSDEESVVQKKRQLLRKICTIEPIMRKKTIEDRQKQQWPLLYGAYWDGLEPRLQRLPK
jgi:hypothetical protein